MARTCFSDPQGGRHSQPARVTRAAAARTRSIADWQRGPAPAISQIRACARCIEANARHPRSQALPRSPVSGGEPLTGLGARGGAWGSARGPDAGPPAPVAAESAGFGGSGFEGSGSGGAACPSLLRASSASKRSSLCCKSCSRDSSSVRFNVGGSPGSALGAAGVGATGASARGGAPAQPAGRPPAIIPRSTHRRIAARSFSTEGMHDSPAPCRKTPLRWGMGARRFFRTDSSAHRSRTGARARALPQGGLSETIRCPIQARGR